MSRGERPAYPESRVEEVVDDYHGTRVADPYRWLEAGNDPQVAAWVEAQNHASRNWLDAFPGRDRIVQRLRQLWDYPRVGLPSHRGERYFFQRNEGLQNQPILYVQEGAGGEPKELLDPNRLREDGTMALTNLEICEDGTRLAYGLSESGSDWQEIRVREVATGKDRPDVLRWVRFTGIAWTADGDGFFYSRYADPATVPAADAHFFQKLYHHRLGDDQEQDRLIYERPEDRMLGVSPAITEDGRFLLIHVFRGTDKDNEILLQRLDRPDEPIRPLMAGFDAAWGFLGAIGDDLFFRTDRGAPRGRVVRVNAGEPEMIHDVVPECDDVLDFGAVAGGRLVLAYLHNAHHRLEQRRADGGGRRPIELPGIGSVTGLSGRGRDRELFVAFSSFTLPTTGYRYDVESGAMDVFHAPEIDLDPSLYETRQVWFESRDGTRVPMFLVHRNDVAQDGDNPVRLYGYGGFNINITPAFNPTNIVWLEHGGVLAYPNLRGGAEFGEEWHQAGMLANKQNVFDDFIAAGEWLIENRYTRRQRLAIQGGSNGGLLTGACLVQRPDLFGAVVAQVPVLDMLRFQLWTIGRYWVPEYGSSEDPEQFPTLLAYSPYHNLQPAEYPPTLITTGDTDDRVDPAHARKFMARLQAAGTSPSPALLRVELRAGHGAGKPTEKVLQEAADIYAFLFRCLGIEG